MSIYDYDNDKGLRKKKVYDFHYNFNSAVQTWRHTPLRQKCFQRDSEKMKYLCSLAHANSLVLIFHTRRNLFVIQMITANGINFIFPCDLEVNEFSILGEKKQIENLAAMSEQTKGISLLMDTVSLTSAYQNIMNESLVGPCVMEWGGKIQVAVGKYKYRPLETTRSEAQTEKKEQKQGAKKTMKKITND